MAAPAPDMAAKTPMAWLRSLPAGKVVVMSASAFGAASAPPRPCTRTGGEHHRLVLREAGDERGER